MRSQKIGPAAESAIAERACVKAAQWQTAALVAEAERRAAEATAAARAYVDAELDRTLDAVAGG